MISPGLPGYWKLAETLKGLRHEDFAVLGQFCAKIIAFTQT